MAAGNLTRAAMQRPMLHLRKAQGFVYLGAPIFLFAVAASRPRSRENRGQPMSGFLFVTVVAVLVSGGLFTRSLLELNWPGDLPRITGDL
jgi:hypothetical protein